MRFGLQLGNVGDLPQLLNRYDRELDDVRSILGDVCGALASATSAEFVVSGFGQERWPVDVQFDLPIFLDQLPGAVSALASRKPFVLDFYEQGVERSVCFECCDDVCVARCESRTDWRPAPEIEQVARMELLGMLLDFKREFVCLLERVYPHLSRHPWIAGWER